MIEVLSMPVQTDVSVVGVGDMLLVGTMVLADSVPGRY